MSPFRSYKELLAAIAICVFLFLTGVAIVAGAAYWAAAGVAV